MPSATIPKNPAFASLNKYIEISASSSARAVVVSAISYKAWCDHSRDTHINPLASNKGTRKIAYHGSAHFFATLIYALRSRSLALIFRRNAAEISSNRTWLAR